MNSDNLEGCGLELNNLAKGMGEAAAGFSSVSDMLLDLEVPVSISFGRTRLMLKEVMGLSLNSLVELDRNIDEPVEVLANDRLIARGEIVAVGGNYGVRILEVIDSRSFSLTTAALKTGAFSAETNAGEVAR